MNLRLKNLWLLLLVVPLVLVLSCERTADVSLPPYKPVLVLHGYMAVGDTFKIALGRTFRADVRVVDSNTYVKDGTILLYENNVFRDTLVYRPLERRYVSAYIAKTGSDYKVVASAPGFETVEATATPPAAVPTIAVSHIKNARTDNNGNVLDDVRVRFLDPAGERNFYLTEIGSPIGTVCLYTDDPVVERTGENFLPPDFNFCIGNRVIYSDNNFNGTQKELSLSGLSAFLETFVATDGTVYKPYVKRYHITEAYYRYFKTSRPPSPELFTFTNPIVVNGNVRNGHGLFTVFSVTVDSLQ